MLQTIEAILEPSGEVRLLEQVHVSTPARALLTILETPASSERGVAVALLKRLRDNPLPQEGRRSEAEIDTQIEQERNAWE
ncbi:MAG: hypothetical protein ACRERU_00980 [Methylococcales bacterium]